MPVFRIKQTTYSINEHVDLINGVGESQTKE